MIKRCVFPFVSFGFDLHDVITAPLEIDGFHELLIFPSAEIHRGRRLQGIGKDAGELAHQELQSQWDLRKEKHDSWKPQQFHKAPFWQSKK